MSSSQVWNQFWAYPCGAKNLARKALRTLQQDESDSSGIWRKDPCHSTRGVTIMRIEVIGVYPVRIAEPCHLIELWVRELAGVLRIIDFTQELEGQPRENWQVPYDEPVLNESGTMQAGDRFPQRVEAEGGDVRLAFFFHYLDLAKPLLTRAGPLVLPGASAMPSRLRFFTYESPD